MLESNPFANHPNATENLHFVGAGMSRSPVSPQYMSATGTPSPAQQTDHMVDDLDAEENETNNIPDDSRTDKHLNWSVPEDIRLVGSNHAISMHTRRLKILFFLILFLFYYLCRPVLGCIIQRTQLMEMKGRQMLIGQMLLKNTTRPQKLAVRGTGIN